MDSSLNFDFFGQYLNVDINLCPNFAQGISTKANGVILHSFLKSKIRLVMLSCPLCAPQAQLLSNLAEFHASWYELVTLNIRRMPHFIFTRNINGNMASMRTLQAGAI